MQGRVVSTNSSSTSPSWGDLWTGWWGSSRSQRVLLLTLGWKQKQGSRWSDPCLLSLGFVEKLIVWLSDGSVKVSAELVWSQRRLRFGWNFLLPFVVFDGCQPWTLTHTEGPESADTVLILFHRSDIPLPPMSAQSCWWVIAEQNFYYIHHSSIFHCATASIKTSDLKICSDGLNKSNQDVNESICLPGFLLFFFSPGFPSLNILSPACFSMSFLFAVFGLMSPHSATDVMESKCSDETTLSSPTCLAGSLIVLSIQVWKTWLGVWLSCRQVHLCLKHSRTSEIQI